MKMIKTMRWFGPEDPVPLSKIRQAGAEGIVTALHQIPVGEIWSIKDIEQRKELTRKAGLPWLVVESLPVHEDIKKGTGEASRYIDNYAQSLKNLAHCGIHTVTYNFMPVLDWVRTDHRHPNTDGTSTLDFSYSLFAYFDLELLKRPGAEKDYPDQVIEKALQQGAQLSSKQRQKLVDTTLLALPGSKDNFTKDKLLELLSEYNHIDAEAMKRNLIAFLKQVVPVAEEAGIKLTIHPDDPPFPLLGLPRVMSTLEDVAEIMNSVDSMANGLCYCTGSFGANHNNNLLQILEDFGHRIHFLHLRNVIRFSNKNFRESPVLKGDAPMFEIVEKILQIMTERKEPIPMRPDHGFLHSVEKDTPYYPGYSFMGRMRSLAELTGIEHALLSKMSENKRTYNYITKLNP